jgi:hypothetical protein
MFIGCSVAIGYSNSIRPRGEVWNQVCHPQERGGHYGAESARRAVF